MLCEESTVTELKADMVKYFLNETRRRTVDEQLRDLSRIMKSSLDLSIEYSKSELEVIYRIGFHRALVIGTDESVRMQIMRLYYSEHENTFRTWRLRSLYFSMRLAFTRRVCASASVKSCTS